MTNTLLKCKDISRLDLSKSVFSNEDDLKYYMSEYEYHLDQVKTSYAEVMYHVDKAQKLLYLIEKSNKNLNG